MKADHDIILPMGVFIYSSQSWRSKPEVGQTQANKKKLSDNLKYQPIMILDLLNATLNNQNLI